MGVYQSATEPNVRRKSLTYMVLPYELEVFGASDVFARLRRAHKIPLKVTPTVEVSDLGTKLVFSWFEVETFN